MPWDLLIRDGSLVTPDGVRRADVAIEGEKIVEIGPALADRARASIDASGLHLFPGLIDPHVHFNEPGRTEWDGFATGSAALAAGGGACFFDMPLNSSPPTLDGESFDLKLAAAKANSCCDFALWGGLTPANLNHMEELAERGVIGFKAFMSSSGIDDFGRADDLTLLRAMEIAARLKLPVAVHAESEELTSRLTVEARAAGRRSAADYLATRPIIAEVDAIRRAIAFARETGCSLHIVHISSAAGAMEVQRGRIGAEFQITGETCPHYLALCDQDLHQLGAVAKCAPPLRNNAEVNKLWRQMLHHGGIDWVASDHSPAPLSMKQSDDFFAIWGGIAGVQSTLGILLSHGNASLEKIATLTAAAAADRFKLPGKGKIAVGADADLALVDVSQEYQLQRENLLDRHKLSPYIGRRLRGVVRRTMVRGNTVFLDGRRVGQFHGRLLRPGGGHD